MAKNGKKTNPKSTARKIEPRRLVVGGLAVVLALLMLLPIFSMIVGNASAVTQSEIDALKKEQEESQAKQEELKDQLADAEADQAAAQEKRQLLTQQLEAINAEIENINAQISYYDGEIAQKEEERKEAEAREQEQYELFCERVRAMEEEGSVSYWSILFNAESFSDLLDRIAEDFGETCYEVPVGFKYVSAKMVETGAIIGGESSGGLTVRGHIQGKDGIYAAALLVEAIAKTGRRLSALWDEITQKYGAAEMAEHDFHFSSAERTRIFKLLMEDKQLPDFPCEIAKVSYMDGCKVYFKNGGWVIARFSGTEQLLRVFCEMDTMENAEKIAKILTEFLSL